jgi:Ca-activated chloride channel family protein
VNREARVLLVAGALAIMAGACRSNDARARGVALFELGRDHYQYGDFGGAGDAFEAAMQLLESHERAQASYNRGNALARQGRLREALDAYSVTLRIVPGDENARYNRALVESWLARRARSGPAAMSREQAQAVLDTLAASSGSGAPAAAKDW